MSKIILLHKNGAVLCRDTVKMRFRNLLKKIFAPQCTMLVAHITARLLELRPGLSVIKDGDDGDDGDWVEMSARAL